MESDLELATKVFNEYNKKLHPSSVLNRLVASPIPEDHVKKLTEFIRFINGCHISGSRFCLYHGDSVIVRIRLRHLKKRVEVTSSEWFQEVTFNFFRDLPLDVKSLIGCLSGLFDKERLDLIDRLVSQERSEALTNNEKIEKAKTKIDKHRTIERKGKIKSVKCGLSAIPSGMTKDETLDLIELAFRQLPKNSIKEDDIVKLWRESIIEYILES